MAWADVPDRLYDKGSAKRRRRREHQGRVPQPGIPQGPRNTPSYDRRLHQGKVRQPGVPLGPRNAPNYTPEDDGGDFVGALTSLAASPAGTLVGGVDNPISSTIKGVAEDEAKRASSNLVDVLQENYPGVFGGEPRLDVPGQDLVPSANELEAVADVTTLAAPEALGLRAAGRFDRAAELLRATQKAADESGAASKAVRALGGSPVRSAAGKAARKVEPAAVKSAREAVATRGAAIAEKVPKPVREAAKIAARGASFPVRKPLTAPFAFEAPAAIQHGDPSQLGQALQGTGTYASIAGSIGDVVPAAKEAVDLPATILPSSFLVGKAGVEAAQGDTKEIDALWDEYLKTGILPAIAEGDLAEAKKRFGEHPLFSALEASGAVNAAGRVAGAGARALPGKAGSLERAPEVIKGADVQREREYSRDLLRQGVQRLADRRGRANVEPGTHRARRIEKEAQNRFEAGSERVRKRELAQNLQVLNNLLPRRGPKVRVKGHVIGKIDRRTSEVVNLAVERLIQSPETFHRDLEHYKAMVDAARDEKTAGGQYVLNRSQRRASQALSDQMEAALKVDDAGRIEATVKAANEFIRHQNRDLEEMHDLGFLTPEQAARASLIPFARVHLGSKYDVPKDRKALIDEKQAEVDRLEQVRAQLIGEGAGAGTIDAVTDQLHSAKRSHENAVEKHSQQVDPEGNALPTERIVEEMERRGIEPPGFLSHRDPTSGDFFGPTRGGGRLESDTRTGASAARGDRIGGIEAMVRQVARSTNLLHRARTWNRAITEFGLEVKGIDTAKEAKAVINAPERYGMPHETELVAVPRYPFGARKAEREGAIEAQDPRIVEALEHADPTTAGDAADRILHDELQAAFEGKLDPDAQVVLMPAKVAEQFLKGSTAAPGYIRAIQAYTNLFKRAVLPFSPGFYIGNIFDNYMRTALAGINPLHFVIGHQVLKNLDEGQRAEALPKAHFASVEGLAPHRSVESLVKGADPLSKGIRAATEWSRKHGWKQAAVKFGPQLLKQGTHYLLAVNAFISEDLPQRGAIGKLALAEMSKTQGSWLKAIQHFDEIGTSFAKGLEDRSKMVPAQKYLEEIYGNYTNMSADARKLLGSITPFWTWMRAAYKFVYLTMPAHHSISTAVLTGMAQATLDEREQWGLDKGGERPLPDYLQGSLPWPDGGIVPFSNYNSFGYAADPLDGLAKVVLPQFLGPPERLKGVDWKGDPIEGEGNQARAAAFAFASSLLPGWNALVHESKEGVEVGPSVNLPHKEDAGYVNYARDPKQTITVPEGSGSSSGPDYSNVFSGGGSQVDYGSVFSGGG